MIGVHLQGWIIDSELGRGGMGTVYRASRAPGYRGEHERAAIKVLAAELAVEVGFQQRFQREIDILRNLQHPAIVELLESGRDKGRFWFAMELIDGTNYEELRTSRRRIPWPEVLDLAIQLTPALKHAHDRGVIHRDIKPSNILRIADGDGIRVKLTDFGIASLFASPHLTVTGGVIGTPEYLSPEQASGKPVTKRSDLYSLGVVLYTLLTGRPPFTGTPTELLHHHRYGQFDKPSSFVPDLPHDLEDAVCSLLEKEPERRPPDAGVFHRRLDSIRRKLARQATPDTVPARTREAGASGRVGPATLMSRLMRVELDSMNRGGPVRRFLSQPVAIVALFLLCIGTITWSLWPVGEGKLFARGSALMASDDPDDWEKAWEKYLEPLEAKFPDHEHREEVEGFRRKVEASREESRTMRAVRTFRRASEGQWFYERGLRLRLQGKEAEARKVWEAFVAAYANVATEKPWVEKMRKELREEGAVADERGHGSLAKGIEEMKALRVAGKPAEADAMGGALRRLYADDAKALEMIGR